LKGVKALFFGYEDGTGGERNSIISEDTPINNHINKKSLVEGSSLIWLFKGFLEKIIKLRSFFVQSSYSRNRM